MTKLASRAAPIDRPNDTPLMRQAVLYLKNSSIEFIRPTAHQLKIGPINFYPDRGTIQLDGERARKERGLDALRELLSRLRGPTVLAIESL